MSISKSLFLKAKQKTAKLVLICQLPLEIAVLVIHTHQDVGASAFGTAAAAVEYVAESVLGPTHLHGSGEALLEVARIQIAQALRAMTRGSHLKRRAISRDVREQSNVQAQVLSGQLVAIHHLLHWGARLGARKEGNFLRHHGRKS